MRKPLAVLALIGVLVAAAATGAGAAAQHVYITSECKTPALMPRAVVLACADDNLYVTRLKYQKYGAKTAVATGLFHEKECTPNCAAGHFHVYSGKVVFRDIVRCGGRLYYSRAEYRFSGPDGSGDADVEPIGAHCTAVKS